MIEFSKTGPLGRPAERPVSPLFIGVGGAGAAVIDQVRLLHEAIEDSIYVIDTDLSTVRGSVARDKFLLGREVFRGLGGCSDAPTIAEITRDRHREILDMLEPREWAVLVCGLGGATGTGATYDLVKMLNGRNTRVMVVAILPFDFEAEPRKRAAQHALLRLEGVAELVLACENERLTGVVSPDIDFREGMHEMNSQVARAIVDFSRVVISESPVQLDLDDCREFLGTESGAPLSRANCWISHGEDDRGDAEFLVEQALDGIQFRDGKSWDQADGMLATLIGGPSLSMEQSQDILRALAGMVPDGMEIKSGALCDPALRSTVRLTVIATRALREDVLPETAEEPDRKAGVEAVEQPVKQTIKQVAEQPDEEVADMRIAPDPEEDVRDEQAAPHPEVEPLRAERETASLFEESALRSPVGTPQRYFSEQEELPLDRKEDRGWFEKTDPTTYNGQDLDRPTFQRLGIKIRL